MRTAQQKAEYTRCYLIKYRKSTSFKERARQYSSKHSATPKRRAYLAAYRTTDKYKCSNKRRLQSEHGRSLNKRRVHRYRATLRNVAFKDADHAIKAIDSRETRRCFYCGTKTKHFEIEHINPISKGGLHSAFNLAPSCLKCNRSKGNKHPNQFIKHGQLILVY